MARFTIVLSILLAVVAAEHLHAEEQLNSDNDPAQAPDQRPGVKDPSLLAVVEGTTNARHSPDDIDFELYSNITVDPTLLSASSPASFTFFNSRLPLVVVIHGYSTTITYLGFLEKIRDELFKKDQYNVLLVRWTKLSQNKLYNVAAGNVVYVGEQIAALLQALEVSAGLVRTSVHLVGFSLGAHVAGHAGRLFPGLGRITGLDPAGPLFNFRGPEDILDKTDADFVDVIHTDSGSLVDGHFGYHAAQGHVDFFVNGGSEMPGCEGLLATLLSSLGSDEDAEKALDSCSHVKAYQYFIESINSPPALAYRCTSYDAYKDGLCTTPNSASSTFGYRATNTHYGNFYSQTQSAPPYLSRQLLLEGSASVQGAWSSIQGSMTIAVSSPGRDEYIRPSGRIRHYSSGSSFRASVPLPLVATLESTLLTITFLETRRPFSWLFKDTTQMGVRVTVTDIQSGNRKMYSCHTALPDQRRVVVQLRASPCLLARPPPKKRLLKAAVHSGVGAALRYLTQWQSEYDP